MGSGKSSLIHNLALNRNPALTGLVEAKHSIINSQTIGAWWGNVNLSWEDILVLNGGGGLILTWNEDLFL